MVTRAYGRVVEHDDRSRRFAVAPPPAPPKTVLWEHRAPVLDQGQVGACTGNALAQMLNCERFAASRIADGAFLTEENALRLYSLATELDDIPGTYPPDDTGSSGLAVSKAGVSLGYLRAYQHAFGLDHALAALQTQPVIVGTVWTKDMETPGSDGFITPTGGEVGGHEYLLIGCDVEQRFVTLLNSWSDRWGDRGRARIRFDDFAALLAQQGDVTAPVGVGDPT